MVITNPYRNPRSAAHAPSAEPTLLDLKRRAHLLDPIVRIGKSGLSDAAILEIKKQLERHKLIKIKFLRSLLEQYDKKTLFSELTAKTGATLVQHTGFTACLWQDLNRQKRKNIPK